MPGPDGIQLDVLVTASAVDQLDVWDPGADWICIALMTYGGNAQECSVDGMASKTGDGEFLFGAGACVIRVLLRGDYAELEVTENGCKPEYCATNSAVESARYLRR